MLNFQFSKTAKILMLSTAVVLLAAGCNQRQQQVSGTPAAVGNEPTSTPQSVGVTIGQKTPPPAHGAIPAPTSTPPEMYPGGNPGGPPRGPEIPLLTVTQIVDGSAQNKSIDAFTQGETAIELLKQDHTVQTEEFTGLGEMVLAIDGVAPGNKQFWEFYVNGQSSNLGASSYVLKNGDKIEWKLSTINSSGE